ncbi:MAG: hypothetical protein ACE37H_13735 [Phycisphaeraceae bacterium]
MHCTECGYDLRGLSEHACPECGRAFDPADQQSFGKRHAARYRELARIAGWLCVITAVIPALIATWQIATGRQDLMIVIMVWLFALVPLALLCCAWVGCLAGAGRLPSWRALLIGLVLFGFNASLLTEWPANTSFYLHRSALNAHAQRAQQLHTYNVPTRIGIYPIDNVSSAPTPAGNNAIFFRLKSNPSGPAYLVYGMADRDIDTYFNVWSYRRLDNNWHIVHED